MINNPRLQLASRKIIAYAFLWCIAGILFSILERGVMGETTVYPSIGGQYNFRTTFISTTLVSLMAGFIIGSIEAFYFSTRLRSFSFTEKLLFKTCVYVAFILMMVLGVSLTINAVLLQLPIYRIEVVKESLEFFSDFAFWSIVIYAATMVGFFQFFFEVSDSLGYHVLINFFTGRYKNPVEEKRIFMFLDLKDSTTVAEKIGHITYFNLLKNYYADISESLLAHWGEVYQYVGDEIVVSWKIKKGKENFNCIRCFFEIVKTIEARREFYLHRFGHKPEFKAGIHVGNVSVGEIGTLKKEILFSGDVLNTTSRLQNLCKPLGVKLLVSEDLVNLFDDSFEEVFTLKEMGPHQLRGKNEAVLLYTVEVKSRTGEQREVQDNLS